MSFLKEMAGTPNQEVILSIRSSRIHLRIMTILWVSTEITEGWLQKKNGKGDWSEGTAGADISLDPAWAVPGLRSSAQRGRKLNFSKNLY